MKKVKTKKFLRDSLFRLYQQGHGQSKHKNAHNATPYIHSHNTYKTYRQQCDKFGGWAHEHGYTDPEKAREAIPDYIRELINKNMSSWSVYVALCAICKAYEMTTEEVPVDIPKRSRRAIRRSRYDVENDRHISAEKNKDLITFCKCFGLRNNKELKTLRGNQIRTKDGNLAVEVKGKGGKMRTVSFYGSDEEKEICRRLLTRAGNGLVFDKVPSNFDAHHLRSIFACRVYRAHARPSETLPKSDKYCCRKEYKGIVYDRRALLICSKELGHNREEVVVNSYLYSL